MRRRDVLAGLGSVGVVAGAGAVAVYGLPSTGNLEGGGDDGGDSDGDGEADRIDPAEIETVDAPGSEAGEILVPASDDDRPTFIDFFGTWCPPCIDQMPALAAAHDRVGDEVLFISITSESVGEDGMLTEAELVDWWDEHDGSWTLGLDPSADLSYLATGYPTAMAIDADGYLRWSETGTKTADELVAGIEHALEVEDGNDGAD
ncbi:TlpA family protein disulfide reductase [Halobiforma nitratireducens]|uniref:Alkyl hydroperoxide reductase/ thiol specific antioxidant/ Mal allergen n=1 Tax=Halobiforma nitratireducens JCM 10879 TaxID=1227454 RepID=M0LNQ5_9EURY|nr:TlpA disulfide reductase family protein [Halobiforma nitratireducens]EMA35126.1 alkyl hydroperoxide reductase/ thiol specific antioxidant/ Mal allergen [Halobiforma nitratireducens JCM 10879]